jgi:hypothetical protein
VTYAAEFAARGEIAHLEGHLLPAMLVFGLWIAQGVDGLLRAVTRLTSHAGLSQLLMLPVLLLTLGVPGRWESVPTAADRAQSDAIRRYWTEVLAYPLEQGAAITGHWGDLTAFWYLQHGEGIRPDLWAIFPPNGEQFERWLSESGRPLYLAGPLLDWAADLPERYTLTPWGSVVRVGLREAALPLPPLERRQTRFGGLLELRGYRYEPAGPARRQVWLAWQTRAPTSRDLAVSLRLHAPEGVQLYQEDGRLASPWYPDPTLPAGQLAFTVFDFTVPESLPPGTTARIVVYDPATGAPLLSEEGTDVVELGPLVER